MELEYIKTRRNIFCMSNAFLIDKDIAMFSVDAAVLFAASIVGTCSSMVKQI